MAVDLKNLIGKEAITEVLQKFKTTKEELEGKIAAKSDFDGTYSSLTGAPDSLKNPAALTFSGASSESYDGSEAKTVNIPVLAQAAEETLGGIKAAEKAETDTVEAKIDGESGKLYVPTYPAYTDATGEKAGLMSVADKTKLDKFTDADDYAKKTDISSVYRYKGTLTDESELEDKKEGAVTGDVYNLTESSTYGNGANVAWDGTAWDPLGGTVDLTAYAKTADFAEMTSETVDSIWQSVFSPEA